MLRQTRVLASKAFRLFNFRLSSSLSLSFSKSVCLFNFRLSFSFTIPSLLHLALRIPIPRSAAKERERGIGLQIMGQAVPVCQRS